MNLLMAVTFRMPEAAAELLRAVGYELNQCGYFPSGIAFCFLTDAARLLIKEVSLDAYAYWHLVRLAADRAQSLPLGHDDIKCAIMAASAELGLGPGN